MTPDGLLLRFVAPSLSTAFLTARKDDEARGGMAFSVDDARWLRDRLDEWLAVASPDPPVPEWFPGPYAAQEEE